MTYYHTRGPWTIHSRNPADMSIAGPGTPEVASVTLRHASINEWKANGNLIAAAPDMLDELRNTADTLETAADLLLDEGFACLAQTCFDAVKAARDVIAKAEYRP